MLLDKDTVDNIVNVFFTCYPEDEDKRLALLILKIINFKYSFDTGDLTYIGRSPVHFYKKDHLEDKMSFVITPVYFSLYDLESIQIAINSYPITSDIPKVSPLLDSLGWVVRLETDGYKLHFVGSATYEVWKEPIVPWNYDLEEDACDWKSGDDWRDGFNLDRDFPPNWNNYTEEDL